MKYHEPQNLARQREVPKKQESPNITNCTAPIGVYKSKLSNPLTNLALRRTGLERSLEVLKDVVNVLDPDRDTDEITGDTGSKLLLLAELLVGSRGGVNHKGPSFQ